MLVKLTQGRESVDIPQKSDRQHRNGTNGVNPTKLICPFYTIKHGNFMLDSICYKLTSLTERIGKQK